MNMDLLVAISKWLCFGFRATVKILGLSELLLKKPWLVPVDYLTVDPIIISTIELPG